MESLAALCPVFFEIVTTVPEWFFDQSLSAPFTLHHINSDVGLVQKNALEEDLGQTLEALEQFYPLDLHLVSRTAALFTDCALVICDIAPLGIAAARRAGVASVLIENFTWDWIYQQYSTAYSSFDRHIGEFKHLYALADYHIQASPVCRLTDCDLQTSPIARARRDTRPELRRQLQVDESERLVLVTMGGIPGTILPLERMAAMKQCFVLPGTARENQMEIKGNLRLLPVNCRLHHPDLIAACDAVIGKVGYSTMAEVYQADVPFGYIGRPDFRESAVLEEYISREMVSLEIPYEQFQGTLWLERVPELCRLARKYRISSNGADSAARFLRDIFRP